MVALNGTFNAQDVDPNGGDFSPLPPGDYPVMLVNSKMNSSNSGIACEFDVTSGQYQGRKLFCNLGLFAQNTQAVEIGQRLLSGMCHACGRLTVNDTSELHGASMIATVKLQKNDPTRNNITGFKPANGGFAQQHHAPQPQQPPQQGYQAPPPNQPQQPPAQAGTPPWRQ